MGDDVESTDGDERKMLPYPLIIKSDMNDEMRTETTEMCVTACEKYASNNEAAARLIKESMDKKFGPTWHVIVGEGYGFQISHDLLSLLYLFYGGNIAVVLWKCA